MNLRFFLCRALLWLRRISFLKPYKSKSSHRLYSGSDIEKLLLIKEYLYDKKFTIEGARKALKLKLYDGGKKGGEQAAKCGSESEGVSNLADRERESEMLELVRHELNSLKTFIKSRKTGY